MTQEQAIRLLEFHADGSGEDGGRSFVGMLRPYRGLRVEAYDEVMTCLRVLGDYLRQSESLDARLVCSLWSIVWFGRYWALREGSMLMRNGLITPNDAVLLQAWIDQIQHTVSILLDKGSDDFAFTAP